MAGDLGVVGMEGEDRPGPAGHMEAPKAGGDLRLVQAKSENQAE